jgi:acyl transferase domain-containing protein
MPTAFSRTSDMTCQQRAALADAFCEPDPSAHGRMASKRGGFLPDVADFDADCSDSPRRGAESRTERML